MRQEIKFGTGGWRAVIGEDFTRQNVRLVGAGLAQLAKKAHKDQMPIVIGYDRRFLSERAARWMAEVLAQAGIPVLFLHRSAPTPLIDFTVMSRQLFYGVEITASHNPAEYNGVKLIVEEGRDAPLEVTQELEALIAGSPEDVPFLPFQKAVEEGLVEYIENPFNQFLDSIMSIIDMDALRRRGLRVVFDTMHGSGTYPLSVIFHTARCTIDIINSNKDAYFGGRMPAPTETGLVLLQDSVVRGGYDLGIAMDGDGDRLGIVDSNGRLITANEILCLLYYYLVAYKGWKGPAVRNLATTHMLDRIAASFGQKCYEVPVGFKHISSKIDQVDAVLGGESSGGLTVRGHIHGKDSIYAASLFAEMLCVVGKSASQIMDELTEKYGSFVMVEDNLPFDPSYKTQIQHILFEEKAIPAFETSVERVSLEDGCKVYFQNGDFVICRFSGTEPLLRIFGESSTAQQAQKYIEAFRQFLHI